VTLALKILVGVVYANPIKIQQPSFNMLRCLARTTLVARAQSRSISRTTVVLADVDPFTHVS
jgi:hypothetical protein